MIEPSLQAQLQTVQSWDQQLQQLVDTLAPRFARKEMRERVLCYLQGLLGPVERKNGWQLAEYAGQSTPYSTQHLLSRARWDADLVRDDLIAYVKEHFNDPAGVLVLDETSFLKRGDQSVGVAPQYSGLVHDVVNCQVGVFLTYAGPKGHTFLDRALYLPEEWAQDDERREKALIPDAVEFATKPQLAEAMLERAQQAGIKAAWVTGDSVYGADPNLRVWLQERSLAYVLGVHSHEQVFIAGRYQKPNALDLSQASWLPLSAGAGSKGERGFEWTQIDLEEAVAPLWHKSLLIRRRLSDPSKLSFYQVFAPVGTPLSVLVQIVGMRWSIEECIQAGKGPVGLDEYEVRSWQGWYRHITLAMWAHAFLTVVCAQKDDAFSSAPPPPAEPTASEEAGKKGASLREFKRRRGLSCP